MSGTQIHWTQKPFVCFFIFLICKFSPFHMDVKTIFHYQKATISNGVWPNSERNLLFSHSLFIISFRFMFCLTGNTCRNHFTWILQRLWGVLYLLVISVTEDGLSRGRGLEPHILRARIMNFLQDMSCISAWTYSEAERYNGEEVGESW